MRYAIALALPLGLLAVSPAPAQVPASVNVQLSNFKFAPSTIVLDHGRPYVLRLANLSDGGHDFAAPTFFAASAIVASDRGLVQEGSVEVPGGQVREIHLTAPAAAGSYKLKCTHTMHKMFGMSGTIVVR
jgi:uncharacterized cupredoxin-like copper-binding protein